VDLEVRARDRSLQRSRWPLSTVNLEGGGDNGLRPAVDRFGAPVKRHFP
jgi:hypothetical protein